MSWKYGTILHDHEFDRRLMVVREIPKEQAGESDLFEAMVLDDGDYGASEIFWVAVSPRDRDVSEIKEGPNIVLRGQGVSISGGSGGSSTISGTFTMTYDER